MKLVQLFEHNGKFYTITDMSYQIYYGTWCDYSVVLPEVKIPRNQIHQMYLYEAGTVSNPRFGGNYECDIICHVELRYKPKAIVSVYVGDKGKFIMIGDEYKPEKTLVVEPVEEKLHVERNNSFSALKAPASAIGLLSKTAQQPSLALSSDISASQLRK